MANNVIYLEIPSQFNRIILESRYITLIRQAVEMATGKQYEFEFIANKVDDNRRKLEVNKLKSYQLNQF